jgi:hypothetical protein
MLLLSLFRVEATLEMCGVHRDPSALHLLISRRFRPQEVIEKAQAEAAELQANSDEPRKNKREKKKKRHDPTRKSEPYPKNLVETC